jgi:hypothetical protein
MALLVELCRITFLSTTMAKEYPRRGAAPTYITLAILAFVLAMIVIYFFLRRVPPAKSQPDKPQSSQVCPMRGEQNNLS